MSVVICEQSEHIAYITMNRPDKLNALSMKLVDNWQKLHIRGEVE